MKLSEAIQALEDGKTIFYQLAGCESKRFRKLLEINGNKFLAQWWEHSPATIEVSQTMVVDFSYSYEVCV